MSRPWASGYPFVTKNSRRIGSGESVDDMRINRVTVTPKITETIASGIHTRAGSGHEARQVVQDEDEMTTVSTSTMICVEREIERAEDHVDEHDAEADRAERGDDGEARLRARRHGRGREDHAREHELRERHRERRDREREAPEQGRPDEHDRRQDRDEQITAQMPRLEPPGQPLREPEEPLEGSVVHARRAPGSEARGGVEEAPLAAGEDAEEPEAGDEGRDAEPERGGQAVPQVQFERRGPAEDRGRRRAREVAEEPRRHPEDEARRRERGRPEPQGRRRFVGSVGAAEEPPKKGRWATTRLTTTRRALDRTAAPARTAVSEGGARTAS